MCMLYTLHTIFSITMVDRRVILMGEFFSTFYFTRHAAPKSSGRRQPNIGHFFPLGIRPAVFFLQVPRCLLRPIKKTRAPRAFLAYCRLISSEIFLTFTTSLFNNGYIDGQNVIIREKLTAVTFVFSTLGLLGLVPPAPASVIFLFFPAWVGF